MIIKLTRVGGATIKSQPSKRQNLVETTVLNLVKVQVLHYRLYLQYTVFELIIIAHAYYVIRVVLIEVSGG